MLIRLARADDVERMADIERNAGEPFRALGMDAVAEDEPPNPSDLLTYVDGERAFVVVGGDDTAVAYTIFDLVDGAAHIEQVSVDPSHSRHGLGRSLISKIEEWAAARGIAALTLTTFVEVPWNGPYYARLGFRYLKPEEEGPQLRAIRRHEAELGLDRWPRASMSRPVASRTSGVT